MVTAVSGPLQHRDMKRALAVLAALTAPVGLVHADVQGNVADAPANPLVTPWSRAQPTYVVVDPGLPTFTGDGVSAVENNVIYLNNCKPNGCQLSPGGENAHTNRSSIIDATSTVQPYAYSDDNWAQVVECVKRTYAPFDVEIVTERPATAGYHMAIAAGRPTDVGFQNGVGGVSPFSCGFITGGISFSFANVYGGSVDDICWTVAQETAHSWGLDHKFDNRDPMTYLQSGPSRKVFQNEAGACGEFSARGCQCGGSTMNSFREILDTFGPSAPTPPTVEITTPAAGARLAAEFPIRAEATDDIAISKVELRIDGRLINTLTAAPYVWNAPTALANGNHIIKVTAYDIASTPTSTQLTASIGKPCGGSGDCPGDGQVCVEGRCVAGSGVDGGLGTTCVGNSDCLSGQCGGDGTGAAYCVEVCNPDEDGCPGDFGCIPAGDGGVCWPGAGDDGGCAASGSGGGLSLLALALGALVIPRRRRR